MAPLHKRNAVSVWNPFEQVKSCDYFLAFTGITKLALTSGWLEAQHARFASIALQDIMQFTTMSQTCCRHGLIGMTSIATDKRCFRDSDTEFITEIRAE